MGPKPKRGRSSKSDSKTEDATKVDKSDEASQRFVDDLVTRGEAAVPDERGQLPPGATHEILEQPEQSPPKVKRRRFSAV